MPVLPESDYSGLAGRLLAAPTAHAPTAAAEGNSEGRSPEAVAKGFEEIFASILIKQMRQTVGEGGMFGHDPGDVLGGMFDHFLSQHIAKSGSLGIGKMIRKHLEKRSESHEPRTGNVMP